MTSYPRKLLLSLCCWWKVPGRLGFQTSRHLHGMRSTGPLVPQVYDALKSSGILRVSRGCRGRQTSRPWYHDIPSSSITRSTTNIELNNSISVLTGMERSTFGSGRLNKTVNKDNLIYIKPTSSKSKIAGDRASAISTRYISLCHLNARSINNKSIVVKDFVVDNKVDIMVITETWLRSGPESDYVVRDICPDGYLFTHRPRNSGTGGGVCVLYTSSLRLEKSEPKSFRSFESMEMVFRSNSTTSSRMIVVYRPPSSSSSLFFGRILCLNRAHLHPSW